jgi:hypothetical protein
LNWLQRLIWPREVDRLQRLLAEGSAERFRDRSEALRLEAILEGLGVHLSDPDVPLYQRIGQQRRELRALSQSYNARTRLDRRIAPAEHPPGSGS